ncbi:MAG: biotin/lipoyl-containing protein [Nanoarchaeota archaeon]
MGKVRNETSYVDENDGLADVGFNAESDDSKKMIESVIFLEYAVEEGDEVEEGQTLVTAEVMKGTFELKSPISGAVEALNHDIEDDPDLLKDDAEIWLVRLKR